MSKTCRTFVPPKLVPCDRAMLPMFSPRRIEPYRSSSGRCTKGFTLTSSRESIKVLNPAVTVPLALLGTLLLHDCARRAVSWISEDSQTAEPEPRRSCTSLPNHAVRLGDTRKLCTSFFATALQALELLPKLHYGERQIWSK